MATPEMLDQSSIPGLRALAEAIGEALPDDGPQSDALSRSALDICIAGDWGADEQLASAIEFARRYYAGQESDHEREKIRVEGLNRMDEEGEFSLEWCKWALATWSLDVNAPSNGYEADYLLDFALKAGVSIDVVRKALETHVPGLTQILTTKNISKTA